MGFLVTYATTDGQTRAIAERVGVRLQRMGHPVTIRDIRDLPHPANLAAFDGVIVGGSLHAHGYQWRLRRFVERYRSELQEGPSAFFSVCLAIASESAAERAAAHAIPKEFLTRHDWWPDMTEVFAGALRFSRYGLLRRWIMKGIATKELGVPIDPTRDYVYTDWQQVDAFADAFAARAARVQSRQAHADSLGPEAADARRPSPMQEQAAV